MSQETVSNKAVLIAAISGFILGCLGVVGVVGIVGASESSKVEKTAATPAVTVTVTVPGPVTTVKVPGPVRTVKVPGPVRIVTVIKKEAAPVPALSTVIEDGQWEVGVDVSAGSYKVTAAVDPDAMCYWKITQTGKAGNIIGNDIVKGGRPTVTVKRGQDFTTEDCGTWVRVR